MTNYIITIARGLGSGGSHVARKLSNTLQIPYYDSEILEMASELSGINVSFFYEANEKIHEGKLKIKNSKGVYTGTCYSASDEMYLSNENLFNFQAEIIKRLAIENKNSCIIVGKAANAIIGSLKNVVSVNIQAEEEICVRNIMQRLCTDEIDARKVIRKTNKYRMDYYRYYIGRTWNDPVEYDLTINTGAVGEDYAVEMIIQLMKHRGLL